MQRIAALFLFLISLQALAQNNFERLQQITELKRIAFGSCNDQDDEQPLWKDLIRQKPDLWIWGGDNIYADWTSVTMPEAYARQNAHPDYASFKEQTAMIGTWDDHDYALDNADGTFQLKKESQKLHLDFLEEPPHSPRRMQEGIYTSYQFGPPERLVKVIILDNRYFKALDPDYPILGKTQWDWLEKELTNSPAKIHFITTGLSVLSPLLPFTEEWAQTSEMKRMLELLNKTNPQGVVFLTGDKHFSSVFKRWGHLEFMSSGMTHVADRRTWWYLGQKYPVTYFGLSYGQIDINWSGETPWLSLSMRTPSGKDVHKQKWEWSGLDWKRVYEDKFIAQTEDSEQVPL